MKIRIGLIAAFLAVALQWLVPEHKRYKAVPDKPQFLDRNGV